MKTYWRKLPNGTLAPEDDSTIEWLSKIKAGDVLGGEFKLARNYKFHCKWFTLVQFAFDNWEPAEGPEKNFERFRKEVTMLAGYYIEVPSIRGGVRYEAQSISFSKMDEETFTSLYDATVNALLKWVLKTYAKGDVDRVMSELARWAA